MFADGVASASRAAPTPTALELDLALSEVATLEVLEARFREERLAMSELLAVRGCGAW